MVAGHCALPVTRRQFVQGAGLAGLGLLAGCGRWPGQDQERPKLYRLGLFHVGTDHVPPSLEPLLAELRTLGHQEGTTIHLDWRNLEDENVAEATAREFVLAQMDVIVAFENQSIRAAQAATTTIPVVMVHATAPVANGFVATLAHPGGNLTGFSTSGVSLSKRLQLFSDLMPTLRRVLVLVDPRESAAARSLVELQAAAAALQVEVVARWTSTQGDIERVIHAVEPGEVDGVLVASQSLGASYPGVIVHAASVKQLPVGHVSILKDWVSQGALFSYGPNAAASGPLAARYVDRILKGTQPADLPVEEPAIFEFVINLQTAQALGLTIPPHVLLQATEVL
jgi:putative tryptophan/tyrosine transport system substrate-binding protein